MNRLVLAVLCAWWVAGSGAAQAKDFSILMLSRADDPFYLPLVADDGVARPAPARPMEGAQLAIRDVRAIARATGIDIKVVSRVLAPDADVAQAIREAPPSIAVIADLAGPDLLTAAQAAEGHLAVFNIRDDSDALRKASCALSLFHVPTSITGQTDALAQFVVRRNWKRVLMLTGPLEEDRVLAAAFTASAAKFGARIVADKPFIMGNDPRKREQNSVALMSYADDFDVAFVADTAHDFGRAVPYALARPRPVIGSVGLMAADWDPIADRFGAPQVNNRFAKFAQRPMTPEDWAAWVSVHAIVEAVARQGAATAPDVVAKLADGSVQLDVSKGMAVSFRSWDHQLRQPVMLRSAEAVIDYAPLDGFLHQVTTLDTLGLAASEMPCKAVQ